MHENEAKKYFRNQKCYEVCQVNFEKFTLRSNNFKSRYQYQCNLQGKNISRNNYFGSQPFLYFTKIFVHLSVIAAACYISIYKLTGQNPVNLYLFAVISRSTRKTCEICPKSTIIQQKVVQVSLLLALSIFHMFLVSLLLTLNRQMSVTEPFLL